VRYPPVFFASDDAGLVFLFVPGRQAYDENIVLVLLWIADDNPKVTSIRFRQESVAKAHPR